MATKTPTDRITMRLPVYQLEAVQALVQAERFRNATDVVFHALKEFLERQGSGAKTTLEAQRGMDELKRVAAEKEQLRAQLAELLNKLG
jgi:Arc/MetJ-type ribon-helix-helix transcriptional regulator